MKSCENYPVWNSLKRRTVRVYFTVQSIITQDSRTDIYLNKLREVYVLCIPTSKVMEDNEVTCHGMPQCRLWTYIKHALFIMYFDNSSLLTRYQRCLPFPKCDIYMYLADLFTLLAKVWKQKSLRWNFQSFNVLFVPYNLKKYKFLVCHMSFSSVSYFCYK